MWRKRVNGVLDWCLRTVSTRENPDEGCQAQLFLFVYSKGTDPISFIRYLDDRDIGKETIVKLIP